MSISQPCCLTHKHWTMTMAYSVSMQQVAKVLKDLAVTTHPDQKKDLVQYFGQSTLRCLSHWRSCSCDGIGTGHLDENVTRDSNGFQWIGPGWFFAGVTPQPGYFFLVNAFIRKKRIRTGRAQHSLSLFPFLQPVQWDGEVRRPANEAFCLSMFTILDGQVQHLLWSQHHLPPAGLWWAAMRSALAVPKSALREATCICQMKRNGMKWLCSRHLSIETNPSGLFSTHTFEDQRETDVRTCPCKTWQLSYTQKSWPRNAKGRWIHISAPATCYVPSHPCTKRLSQ